MLVNKSLHVNKVHEKLINKTVNISHEKRCLVKVWVKQISTPNKQSNSTTSSSPLILVFKKIWKKSTANDSEHEFSHQTEGKGYNVLLPLLNIILLLLCCSTKVNYSKCMEGFPFRLCTFRFQRFTSSHNCCG